MKNHIFCTKLKQEVITCFESVCPLYFEPGHLTSTQRLSINHLSRMELYTYAQPQKKRTTKILKIIFWDFCL